MAGANRWLARAAALTLAWLIPSGIAHARGEQDNSSSEPPAACQPSQPGTLPQAPPQDHPRLLREARAAVEELRYDDALALLAAIGPSDNAAIRVQSLEITAVVHLIEGRAAKAQPLLEELYFVAPGFLLDDPSLPPRVTKMFDEEASRPHKRAVKLELRPRGVDRRAFELTAGGATVRVDLACRGGSSGPLLPVATQLTKGSARFRLPSLGRYSCHAVAVDRDGLPLGRFGTPKAPAVITSRPSPPPPPPPLAPSFYETWWFWTIAGSVVAGGIIATVVGASREQEVPDADVTVELRPDGAATILRW